MTPINPRILLREKDGREQLYALLCRAGYVPQKEPLAEMSNAIFMATPIFLSGQRGGGKTAFPEALAKALGLTLFTLVGLPNTNTDYVLSSWDRAAQQHYVGMELLNKTPFAEAQAKQWSRDFLKLGEVLEGFDHAAKNKMPTVILCDEWDKTPEELDSALLQILGRGYVNVPQLRPDNRIGFTPEISPQERYSSYPIVVLTSNNVREFSPPLLSRLWYCHIPSPSVSEMVRILASAVPAAVPFLLYQVTKLINGINGLPLVEKPALREFILLLQTYVAKGYKFLTAEIIAGHIGCLAKNYKDMLAFRGAVEMLFRNFVSRDDTALDELVREVVRRRQNSAPV